MLQSGRGELKIKVSPDRTLQRQLRQVESVSRRLFWGIIFAAFLLAGTLLYLDQESIPAAVSLALAALSLLASLLPGRRH